MGGTSPGSKFRFTPFQSSWKNIFGAFGAKFGSPHRNIVWFDVDSVHTDECQPPNTATKHCGLRTEGMVYTRQGEARLPRWVLLSLPGAGDGHSRSVLVSAAASGERRCG